MKQKQTCVRNQGSNKCSLNHFYKELVTLDVHYMVSLKSRPNMTPKLAFKTTSWLMNRTAYCVCHDLHFYGSLRENQIVNQEMSRWPDMFKLAIRSAVGKFSCYCSVWAGFSASSTVLDVEKWKPENFWNF